MSLKDKFNKLKQQAQEKVNELNGNAGAEGDTEVEKGNTPGDVTTQGEPAPVVEAEAILQRERQRALQHTSKEVIVDILTSLNIPSSIVLEGNILTPDRLDDVTFDLQAPVGYDQGQVQTFMNLAKVSSERYLQLLKDRNSHIAKLATVIDRLQVDINNLKAQMELSQFGVGVVVDNGGPDLEMKLSEANIKIKALEAQLSQQDVGEHKVKEQLYLIEKLKNENYLLNRELNAYKEDRVNGVQVEQERSLDSLPDVVLPDLSPEVSKKQLQQLDAELPDLEEYEDLLNITDEDGFSLPEL